MQPSSSIPALLVLLAIIGGVSYFIYRSKFWKKQEQEKDVFHKTMRYLLLLSSCLSGVLNERVPRDYPYIPLLDRQERVEVKIG